MNSTKDNKISQKLQKELSDLDWLDALTLLVLPWAKPFLPLIEIPKLLEEKPSLWTEIYDRKLASLKTRSERPETMTRQELEAVYPLAILQAMHQLAERGGKEVALELERWVRRYFRHHESHIPLASWRLVLNLTFLLERHDRIPPPAVLEPIVPEIQELDQKFSEARYEIYEVAPPGPEYEGFSKCFEMTLWNGAAYYAYPIQALRKIAQRLNSIERKEVVNWAEQQAKVMVPKKNPEQLCGDKYLRVEPPGFDMPSILGLSG
ncbi:MAG: hypothetical protein SW833_26840 [Cyanobacteriota bacterium]|nr:hypothetical protein [Cyanobacteriota bacterium]